MSQPHSQYAHHGPPPPPYQTHAETYHPSADINQNLPAPTLGSTQTGSGYTYMPVPIMMPAYPPQQQENPTYITNYIVQPQPMTQPQLPQATQPPHSQMQMPIEPERNLVRVVEDVIEWIPATPSTAQKLSSRAVVAGHEGWDHSPLWVIRAHSGGDLIPGKLAVKHRSPYVGYAGKEIFVNNFEVLTAESHAVHWIPCIRGQVPSNAIVGGNTKSGEPLYIGRSRHLLSLTPGKVHPSHGCCYISFAGREIPKRFYEVLCKVG